MPRTKRPVRKQDKLVEENDNLKKLNNFVAEQKSRIDEATERELRALDISMKILLETIRSDDLNKTIGQLKTEMHLTENTTPPVMQPPSRSASQDDGYLTENNSSHGSGERTKKKHGIPVSTSRSTAASRRSRSADPTLRKPSSTASKPSSTASKPPATRRRSRSVYRTPAINKHCTNTYPIITPKVAPHTPLTVLRQPRLGEMVVSMSGSPVMVPSFNNMQRDEVANCNIMLQDGTMLSLQPKQLRQSQAYIPFSLMDQTVLAQLKTLKDNLEKVVRLGEKNINK